MDLNLSQRVRDFVAALQSRKSFEDLLDFYHPDVQQIEYPNGLLKQTAVRNLDDLRLASERGKKVLLKEVYEITHLFESGNTVVIEAVVTMTLAVPFGDIPAGGEWKAWFAQFFEFKDGKIYRQRNYDCFAG